ncbi:uncharacterized protein LOC144308928 [Canis aureus]
MGLQTGGTTWEQMEGTQTPQPPEASELLAADRAMATMTTGKSSLRATPPEPTKGTTLSKRQSPGRDIRRDPPLRPTGSSEDNPFSYDEDTLRKRGLLATAVLFITGIVILTSGKCRWLPQLCRNSNRIVSKAQPGREDPDGVGGVIWEFREDSDAWNKVKEGFKEVRFDLYLEGALNLLSGTLHMSRDLNVGKACGYLEEDVLSQRKSVQGLRLSLGTKDNNGYGERLEMERLGKTQNTSTWGNGPQEPVSGSQA